MRNEMPCPEVPFKVFIVAGMPRSGTTFLYHNLQKHPSVYLPFRKETNYFSFNYDKGVNWYKQLYQEMRPGQIGADISPPNFLDERAVERIKKFAPEIKVILGVRDPAEWVLSLYSQVLTFSWRVQPFEKFIESYLWQIDNQKLLMVLRNGFVTRMIENYRQAFGDNLLLYHFNLFQRDPLVVLRSIECFVGIPHYFTENNFDNIVINAGRRRNIRVVSYILSRPALISFLGAVFPRRSVLFLRSAFEKMSKAKGGKTDMVHSPEDIQLAKVAFAEEDGAIRKLFAQSAIQLGTGTAFHCTH